MKVINLEKATLGVCVSDAQKEGVIIMRKVKPVALIVGVQGKDTEPLQLSNSNEFWKLMEERRAQKIVDRSQLERRIAERLKAGAALERSRSSGRRA